MKFLIVYGTTEGQTRKIAEFVKQSLTDAGHQVELRDSKRRMKDIDWNAVDGVIIAGSVHQNVHQDSINNFAIAHRKQLLKLPNLMISVSLSVAFDDGQEKARDYVDEFVGYTGFVPQNVLLVAGALRYDEYDFFMEQIVEFVVLKNHEEITSDREFTKWEKLAKDIEKFADSVDSQP